MIDPAMMTSWELDATATAIAHLLGLDGKAGDLGILRGPLRALQEAVAGEQTERRAIAKGREPVGPSRE